MSLVPPSSSSPVPTAQLLDMDADSDEEEDGGATDIDAQRKGMSCVLKTSTRQVRWSFAARHSDGDARF